MPTFGELDELSKRMLTEIAHYVGWDYSPKLPDGSRMPARVAMPCLLAPANIVWAPGKKTDTVCCVFVAGVIGRVYDKTAKWSSTAWQRFMIPASEPWGPVNEAIAAGIGKAYSGTPQPGKWYIVQKWTGLVNGQVVKGASGHQWLQWGPDLLVEANTYTDEDADGSATDEGAVAWRHKPWTAKPEDVKLVELF
jgi:hypothetical protein